LRYFASHDLLIHLIYYAIPKTQLLLKKKDHGSRHVELYTEVRNVLKWYRLMTFASIPNLVEKFIVGLEIMGCLDIL